MINTMVLLVRVQHLAKHKLLDPFVLSFCETDRGKCLHLISLCTLDLGLNSLLYRHHLGPKIQRRLRDIGMGTLLLPNGHKLTSLLALVFSIRS